MAPIQLVAMKTPRDIKRDEEQEALLDSNEAKPLFGADFDSTGPGDKIILIIFRRIMAIWMCLLVICVGIATWSLFLPDWYDLLGPSGSEHMFSGNTLRSNGTHEYKRTVLMVSIDGLRADYLDRGLTPHLLAISKKGLRAKSMRPIFPTLTFPNHWALMTGLFAESHGIVANNFWDPVSQEEFKYNKAESAHKPDWWLGEPMWETAEKAGVTTANLMWPGPPKTLNNGTSKYFIPWKDHVPLSYKLDKLLEWVDMPLESRPQLILAYEPSLDQAGHATGPFSKRVNATLVAVDTFAKELTEALESRNLTDIIDVIFVSDHGMTDTNHPELIYLDDLIGKDGVEAIEHEDGWPAMGIRFRADVDITEYFNALVAASAKNPEKLDVYTTETMPTRFHFAKNERIAPIWVVPKIGYVMTTRAEGSVGMNKGSHGYDNSAPSMHAMFVAHGPFSYHTKAQVQNRGSSARMKGGCHAGWHTSSQDTYIMDTFQNLEIYNLVMRLLGIEKAAATNNGTVGFWDQYL